MSIDTQYRKSRRGHPDAAREGQSITKTFTALGLFIAAPARLEGKYENFA